MYTRLTSPSRMSAHTTHSRSRSPWLWAFLIMFMIWGVWVLLPQPDHLAASSDITDQQQHAKTFSSLANAQPATSPSDDLKSSNNGEDVTEDSVVADAIKSLLDDEDESSEIKSSSTINSEETKEENNEDDEEDDDDDDEEEEEVAQPTETSKPSATVSLEPTSIVDIDIDNTPSPSQTSILASSDSVENSNDGVGIVIHTHDDNIDNNSLVLEEPTKTIDLSQAQITSVPVDNLNDNGENEVKQGGKGDQEDDAEGEDSLVMSITAVSWPAGAVATEI